jgi:RPA family protein
MEEYESNTGADEQEEIELGEDEVELENIDDLEEIRLVGETRDDRDDAPGLSDAPSQPAEPPDIQDYAAKVYAMEIVSGEFVRGSGSSRSYLRMWNGEDIDKVRVMGSIVQSFLSNDGNYCAHTLDDGTETIRVKGWREDAQSMSSFNVGQVLDVFGGVREYDGEVYLQPIAMNAIEDPNWEPLRELEIFKLRKVKKNDLQL